MIKQLHLIRERFISAELHMNTTDHGKKIKRSCDIHQKSCQTTEYKPQFEWRRKEKDD
jgi:hypothetical protein